MSAETSPGAGWVVRAAVWLPGLVVALGAAVATAHGLYEVAVAARVPQPIAWLYPLITDGLALVAYAATARLHGSAARYAWTVVVIAAGLSGLAQAAYLAGDGGPAQVAPALRFGVGAWPAVAAAVVAHLLYLLASDRPPDPSGATSRAPGVQAAAVQPGAFSTGVQRDPFTDSWPLTGPAAGAERPAPSGRESEPSPPPEEPRPAPSPARDRAEAAATRHAQRLGAWPTVTELETAAEVSRGTAAAALKALRERPLPLHLINTSPVDDPDDQNEAPT